MIPGWVKEYIGIPFQPGGRTRSGCDCWGLTRLVLAERFGVQLPSFAEEYTDPHDWQVVSQLISTHIPTWCPIAGTPQEGDVALFRILNEPAHVGVIVAPGFMLHVSRGTDSNVERYTSPTWQPRLLGFFASPEGV